MNGVGPVPVAVRSKAWVCDLSLAEIVGANPVGGTDVCCVLCCQAEVSAPVWSIVQKTPKDCGVSVCDDESSIMWRPWPNMGCFAMVKK